GSTFPGIAFYFRDGTGEHRYPADAPAVNVPRGWQNVHGLLVFNHRFYGWAHYIDDGDEITALAPLSNQTVENLVPNLGIIALLETHKLPNGEQPASAGSVTLTQSGPPDNPHQDFKINTSSPRGASRIPPAVNRLDIPVFIPTTLPHFHLDTPGKTYEALLEVY